MRTRIKICGITDPDTAAIAVDSGADAIGLIFYPPSSRYLELDRAARICQRVGPLVSTVAVLVNPDAGYVDEILQQVGPTHLQFHGEESESFCRSFNRPYIKALRVSDDIDLLEHERRYGSAQGILLDTHLDDSYGGTGSRFDWGRARYGGDKHVILAGGLDADNVAEAIKTVRPYAVDISTGVESNGRKDPEKIRRFCRNALNARP